jgi:hypothetical protein
VAALLPCEHRERGGDAVEHALDVDVDHAVPLIDERLVDRREGHQPGVVHEHVHAPELRGRGLNERIDLGALGYVDPHGRGLAACALDVSHNCLEPVHTTRADKHAGALGWPGDAQWPRPAAAGAGDDDDLPFNVRHAAPLS